MALPDRTFHGGKERRPFRADLSGSLLEQKEGRSALVPRAGSRLPLTPTFRPSAPPFPLVCGSPGTTLGASWVPAFRLGLRRSLSQTQAHSLSVCHVGMVLPLYRSLSAHRIFTRTKECGTCRLFRVFASLGMVQDGVPVGQASRLSRYVVTPPRHVASRAWPAHQGAEGSPAPDPHPSRARYGCRPPKAEGG